MEVRRGREDEGEVAGSKRTMPIEIEKLMEVPVSTVKGSKTKKTSAKGEWKRRARDKGEDADKSSGCIT